MNENKEKLESNFATITPSGIIVPDVIDKKGNSKWIKWGDDNKLPLYLWDNYLKCSNLQAIVNTLKDYIIGEGIVNSSEVNNYEINEVVEKCVLDKILFGGFAVECIRNYQGKIVRIIYQNVMNVRVNESLNTAYLSSMWNEWSPKKVVELPLYNKYAEEKQKHFLYYDRGSITRGINPVPCYISALKSIEILNNTRNFHLRNLENGFSANAIININNGDIKSRELAEIKEKLEQGFCGTENAGKFILMNGGDKEHATTVERLNADNFGDLYRSLDESSKEDLYVAFRINPILLGKNVQTGFSKEEFQQAFALYNKTVVLPFQKEIKKSFKDLSIDITFKPFKIIWEN